MEIFLLVLVLVLLGSILYLFVLIPVYFGHNYMVNSRKKLFQKRLSSKIKDGLISKKEDLQIIYDGLLNKENWMFVYNESLLNLVTDYIAETENIKPEVYNLLKDILAQENSLLPFEGVPSEERVILTTINNYLKEKNLTDLSVMLSELGPIMSARYRNYNKTARQTKHSLYVGVFGVIIGVVSLVYAFFFSCPQ